jgi:hypothetical protein
VSAERVEVHRLHAVEIGGRRNLLPVASAPGWGNTAPLPLGATVYRTGARGSELGIAFAGRLPFPVR